jgi:ribosomal protein L30
MTTRKHAGALLRITQVHSRIGNQERVTKVLTDGLGLGRIGRSVVVVDTPYTRGMIAKVAHIVAVEPLAGTHAPARQAAGLAAAAAPAEPPVTAPAPEPAAPPVARPAARAAKPAATAAKKPARAKAEPKAAAKPRKPVASAAKKPARKKA